MTSSPDSAPGGPAAPQSGPAGQAAPRSGTAAFDYDLPVDLIAHHPPSDRAASRLLVVRRDRDDFEHLHFRDIIRLVEPGDVIVLNETRVIPARLLGRRPGGGEAEIVLLHPAAGYETAGETAADTGAAGAAAASTGSDASDGAGAAAASGAGPWPEEWVALVRPGSKLRPGRTIRVGADLAVEIVDVLPDGLRRVRLLTELPVRDAVERYGRVPLPPYIGRDPEPADRERYQTVYARVEGSVAAPTAGLHFTPELLAALQRGGVDIATVVLHVGVGTFRPVEVDDPAEHVMHAEWYEVAEESASRMNAARAAGGRLWAVGTTVARTLESVSDPGAHHASDPGAHRTACIRAASGWTRLFIRPGFEFRAVDRLITNFHLPRSTLIMLVSAFAGRDRTMRAYREAVARRYRFYSYGDAMAIL